MAFRKLADQTIVFKGSAATKESLLRTLRITLADFYNKLVVTNLIEPNSFGKELKSYIN